MALSQNNLATRFFPKKVSITAALHRHIDLYNWFH